jgi:hypothetical protein
LSKATEAGSAHRVWTVGEGLTYVVHEVVGEPFRGAGHSERGPSPTRESQADRAISATV